MTKQEVILELKRLGWSRQDAQGKAQWTPPWSGVGWRPNYVTYATARRRLLKEVQK